MLEFANSVGDNIRFAPPLTLLIVNNTHKKISFAYLLVPIYVVKLSFIIQIFVTFGSETSF